MSYVVNDDIPKSCSKCPQRTLYHGINVCLAANKMKVSTSNKCRHEKCPLVELPKNHGRLIDADDLDSITVVSYPNTGDPFVAGRLKKIIAPTIIEAEASE